MKKIKIEGEGVKTFELEIKEPNLSIRKDLNDLLYKMFNNKEDGMFTPAIDIISLMTKLTDNQINDYTNDEIFTIALNISNFVNRSKKKK